MAVAAAGYQGQLAAPVLCPSLLPNWVPTSLLPLESSTQLAAPRQRCIDLELNHIEDSTNNSKHVAADVPASEDAPIICQHYGCVFFCKSLLHWRCTGKQRVIATSLEAFKLPLSMEPWAASSDGRQPAHSRSWGWEGFKVRSNPIHSLILGFHDNT